jgi:hypothetical protein
LRLLVINHLPKGCRVHPAAVAWPQGTAAVRISGPKQAYTSDCFDHVFDETASNDAVYEQHNGEPLLFDKRPN